MTSTPHTTATDGSTPARGLPRRLLWVLLIAFLVLNGASSLLSLPGVVGVTSGVLVLVLGALLVRDHYRRRARTDATPAPSGPPAG